MILFACLILSVGVSANTFGLKETSNRFTLTINARNLTFISEKRKVERELLPCNLPLVRALNSELLSQIPLKEAPKGLPFQVDGSTYTVSPKGKEARVLLSMDQRIIRYELEEKKACSK
jgi:hypothetical protein